MTRPPQRQRAGVTLLELLVAVAILAIISGLLYGTFSRALAARAYATAAVERYARARAAIDWLEADLEGAYATGLYPSGAKRFFSSGKAYEPTLGGTPLLDITTTSARGTTALVGPILDVDGPRDRGDQARVIYHLEASAENATASEGAGYDLVRYEFRPPVDVRLEEASRAVVGSGIASIELRFFDGGTWREQWDVATATATTADKPARPAPTAVQIRLRLADVEEPVELVSAVRLVLGGPRD